MIKLFFLIFVFLIFSLNISSQITFQENVISTNANGANSVFAIDIDGDGDIDVLSASSGDSKIAWYENTDGFGHFSAEKIISINAIGTRSVFSIDIDGDGNIDVLSASYGKIAWYKNLDGLGTFSTELIIDTNDVNATAVCAADLDNDNDIDVLYISQYETVGWFENTDGLGVFGVRQVIDNDAGNSVSAIDVDNDGDNDIIFNSGSAWFLLWSENSDSMGDFSNVYGVTAITNIESFHTNDINGDGSIDIAYVSYYTNTIAWSENSGVSPALFEYFSYNLIDSNMFSSNMTSPVNCIYTDDIDNDGDVDILHSFYDEDYIKWYENIDGLGSFDTSKIITTNADGVYSIITADIDGDGDVDILSASVNDNKIAWYKNSLIDNINEISQTSFTIYPNPAKNTITIQTEFGITKIELYNNLGQLVLTKQNSKTINVSNLAKGVYNCKAFSKNVSIGTEQMIIE